MIAGYSVHGIQQSTTIPANSALGNTAPITKTIQVWKSSDLRLPLLTVISDPLGGTTTSQYENVSTSTPPDSSLFTIPAGYKACTGSAVARDRVANELRSNSSKQFVGAKRYEGTPGYNSPCLFWPPH